MRWWHRHKWFYYNEIRVEKIVFYPSSGGHKSIGIDSFKDARDRVCKDEKCRLHQEKVGGAYMEQDGSLTACGGSHWENEGIMEIKEWRKLLGR